MKKILIILGVILLVAAAGAGGFYGGMTYQTKQANTIRDSFLASRGLQGQGNFSGGANPSGTDNTARRGFFGGGTMTGQVKSLDGNTLSISTAQDVLTIDLSGSVQIDQTTSAASTDFQPGQQVMVMGTRDDKGNFTATEILILKNVTVPTIPTPAAAP